MLLCESNDAEGFGLLGEVNDEHIRGVKTQHAQESTLFGIMLQPFDELKRVGTGDGLAEGIYVGTFRGDHYTVERLGVHFSILIDPTDFITGS